MPNELADEFIKAAEADFNSMEESRYFGYRTANPACYHAQQYAEKMIKARMIQLGYKTERSHNLVHLMRVFESSPQIDRAIEYCLILTQYEAQSRYPDDVYMEYSPEDAEIACEMALEIPYLIGIYDSPRELSEPRRVQSTSSEHTLRDWFKGLFRR